MFCKRCNKAMRRVMSFYNGKTYEFFRCPFCWYESKKMPFIFKNIELNRKKTEIKSNVLKRKPRTKCINKKKKK